jgi:hypothetical protein
VPIANCFAASLPAGFDPDELVSAWARCSGIGADEMTVNMVRAEQGGKRYAVMAWLYLPSLWPERDASALAEGLAAALAGSLAVDLSAVQVVTSVVPSGAVVETGRTLRW